MRKQDKVILLVEQRSQLQKIISAGQQPARTLNRAHILLQSAVGATDQSSAQALSLSERTVSRTRRRFVEAGLDAALYERPRSGVPLKYDANAQATIIATACTPTPEGLEHWTLAALTERVIELGLNGVSRETVRRTLKKTNCSLIASNTGS